MTAFKSLREIITFKGGGTPSKQIPDYWDGAIPWATVKDFMSTSLDKTQDNITEAGLRNSSANLIPKGYVIIPTRMSLGKAAINTIDAAINQDLRALIPKIPLDTQYLLHAILSLKDEIVKKGSGTTVKGITQEALYNLKVFVPSLDDQKRIAHLLVTVEGLIARRKQHLQKLDDLLKSAFVEMFGIQEGTYKRWTIDKLFSHSEIVSGVTKGKKYKTEELIETPYMRVANVQDGRFDLGEIKTIAVTQKEIDQYLLKPGDLLLTEGGDPDKLGRGSVWEGQIEICIHQNHIFRVRINTQDEINPYYLSALVGSVYGKAYFLKSAKQTTGIASINSTQLKNFPTVIPPINLQNQFAAIVEKVEGLKSRYQQSLTDLESLYGALSQKAFKGELDLSRVPLPKIQTLPADDDLEHERVEPPQPKEDKLDSDQKTDTDQIEYYNTWTFHEFLRTRKDEVWTATDLWEELQKKNFKNPPPSFESFKTWIITCLEQGEWLEQVYGEVTAAKHSNVKKKKIALRIRNDS